MYYVYILISIKDNKRYFGFTENIERRLVEHNSGLVKSTKHRRPLRIIHLEKFESKEEAMKREKELKKKKGKDAYRIPHF
jgi:putative endonuclease